MKQAIPGSWRIARRIAPSWKLGLCALALAGALFCKAAQSRPAFHEGLSFSKTLVSPDGRLIRLLPAADGRYRLWHDLSEFSPLLIRGTRIAEGLAGQDSEKAIAKSLAARVYGDPGPEGETFARRLRVTAAALRLRALYSPDRLMEAYLNLSTYGPGIEGAGAASLVYFGKNPDQLTET